VKRSNGIELLKFSIEKVLKKKEKDFFKCVGTLNNATHSLSLFTSGDCCRYVPEVAEQLLVQ